MACHNLGNSDKTFWLVWFKMFSVNMYIDWAYFFSTYCIYAELLIIQSLEILKFLLILIS